jgi:D-alanyl-D-alanine carboxypeptidase (penicillin-binding protein 5/6)
VDLRSAFFSPSARTRCTAALVVALLLASAFIPAITLAQEHPELQITSTNYIVINADTGEIYAQRGAHEQRAEASITKMFTAIETIESAPGNVEITTSESDMVSDEASQVGFGPGETFTVEELLYGMMLPSGNDAARALARGLGAEPGDSDEQAVQRFVDRINQRVQNMGLVDTHLVDPDGWGVPGHYTSAYDLAAFMMYALNYPRFVQTFSTLTYETADGDYVFKNNNRMLRTYDGIVGGKTGYDDDAGWCLINVAQRDGTKIIAVTLNGVAPDDWYDDNRVLLDFGFEEFARRQTAREDLIGDIVRFRDPDAARILSMGTAGGDIGVAQPLVAPAPTSMSVPAPVDARSGAAVDTIVLNTEPDSPVVIPISQSGASGSGLIAAASVAAALILVQGISTWRLQSRRPAESTAPAVTPLIAAPTTIESL